MAQRVGVVLAGGVGRRFGEPKAAFRVDDRTLAERAAAELWPVTASVLISLAPEMANPAPRYPAMVDPEPAGRGPLVGIAAAYDATGDADLLVLACDYPNVRRPLLDALVERADPEDDVVLWTDFAGRDHPLVAFWRRSARPVVAGAVAAGRYKVRGLLADLRVRRLGPKELPGTDLDRCLLNLNRRQDLATVLDAGARREETR